MTQEVAYRFIEALSALENDGEIDPILDTFSEYCEIESPRLPNRLSGKAQAREFWNGYRSNYRKIRSRFRNIVIGENSIALEWTATGISKSGKQFEFDGVTVLETAGPRITHLRSYFDAHGREQITQSAGAG
jgi:ketosteroid isomerase-like protein